MSLERTVEGNARGGWLSIWERLTGDRSIRPFTVAGWLLLTAAMAIALQGTLRHDFRDNQLVGDQASHLFQAISLAYDDDLAFDVDDIERWHTIGWSETPDGLLFQSNDRGFAFAKPYGYSLYVSEFVRGLGAVRGVAVANSVLLVALTIVAIATLRLRFAGASVPLAVAAFYFFSYPYLYGYVVMSELFLALLIAVIFWLVLFSWKTGARWSFFVAFAAMGFAVSEKASFLTLLFPLAVAVIWASRRARERLALPAVAIIAFSISVIPYLHASDGASWNPYSGERYYLPVEVPFDDSHIATLDLRDTGDTFSVTFARENVFADLDDAAKSAGFYIVGRHTGVAVFIPAGLLVLLYSIARIRRLDLRAWAVLLGILGYIGFYVLLFPMNYYGGGQSLGNRYFLQIAPSLLALAVVARISTRALLICGTVGAMAGIIFLWPHHRAPSEAYVSLRRTSWVQDRFPFEVNQKSSTIHFVCPDGPCDR